MVEDSKIMAALPFSGLPLDNEVRSTTRVCRYFVPFAAAY